MSFYSMLRQLYSNVKNRAGFRFFNVAKEMYNGWFWRERTVFRLRKSEMTPYIIRRYAKNMGIGSYIITNLSHINYALENGYNPVIDMYNYNYTMVDGKRRNTWKLFFSDKTDLKWAYNVRHRLSDGGAKEPCPNDSVDFFNDSSIQLYWNKLFNEYIGFNARMYKYANQEYETLFPKNGRVLGVLCRGTDYLTLRPAGHPCQPTVDEMIQKCRDIMTDYRCEYLYLATEDIEVDKAFRNEFGDCLLINKRVYKNYKDGYIGTVKNERKNDQYLTNCEYLSSLYLLSRCNCFVSGRTSGAVIVMIMDHNFEYSYFWDKGLY